MSNVTRLRTRKPTGKPSWPLILLAGEPKSGKSYWAAQFTGDERIGLSFFLDIGEGTADEYIEVPGAKYEIIDHNGTWVDIVEQVEACRDVARAELEAGRPPVCLTIDSMTAEWAMLSEWVHKRAKRGKKNRALLAENPDAEIDVGHNYWNDGTSRHNRLMNILKTFPGYVIMIAHEKEVTVFDADGKPTAEKAMRPDAQKGVPKDANIWIRLSQTSEPIVVGLRSLKWNIRPGKDRAAKVKGDTLAEFLFDTLGYAENTPQVRDMPIPDADQVAPGEEAAGTEQAERDQRARATVAWALEPRDKAAAAKRAEALSRHAAKGADVLPYLAEEARERLGIRPDTTTLPLAELGQLVASYVTRHGRSVLAPLDEPAVSPARQALEEHADEIVAAMTSREQSASAA